MEDTSTQFIGIDTTYIIDILNGTCEPDEEISSELVVCEYVYFEALLGRNQEKYVELIVNNLHQVQTDFAVARKAAQLFKQLKDEGKEIGQADCLIAAAYLSNGTTKILTRNKKHFAHIPELEFISY